MTSLRQIESNRRNAQKSTGPKTDDGKARASRSAVRHGLTAETVINSWRLRTTFRPLQPNLRFFSSRP